MHIVPLAAAFLISSDFVIQLMIQRNMKSKFVLVTIAIIVVLIIGYALPGGSQILDRASGEKQVSRDVSKPVKPELPEFALKTGRVAEAYIFTAQN